MGLGNVGYQVLHPVPAVDLGYHGRVRPVQAPADLFLEPSDGAFQLPGSFQVQQVHRAFTAAAQDRFLGSVFPDALGSSDEALYQRNIPLGHGGFPDGMGVRLEKIQSFLGGRQGIGQVGQDLPESALGLADVPEGIQDDAFFVHEDDVAVLASEL